MIELKSQKWGGWSLWLFSSYFYFSSVCISFFYKLHCSAYTDVKKNSQTQTNKICFSIRSAEAAIHRYSSKWVFLKISQYYRKTLVLDSHFKRIAELKVCNFIKKRLQRRYFPVNIGKFLWTAFFIEQVRWLLLEMKFGDDP